VLATTNRDLATSVERQEFRQDLYYRLNVFPITVPPLRARKEDIPLLVDAFLKRIAQRTGVHSPTVTPQAMAILMAYDWPGNVRELQNVIERAVILHNPEEGISAAVMSPMFPNINIQQRPVERIVLASGSTLAFPEEVIPLESIEREYIMHALRQAKGNRTHTAQMLGISIRTLRNKLNQLKGGADEDEDK
jgi:two-component system response regulator FlrC